MQRITVTLDDDLMAEIDRYIAARGYQNRSEAIRDIARLGLQDAAAAEAAGGTCVAALVYVYNHHARDLSKRLVEAFHDHHELSLATMHVHLDHDSCMEVALLKGATGAVRQAADHVIAERGVRHGRLVVIPTEVEAQSHGHGDEAASHSHEHVRVK
ncbi:MAG: nickel-responsive transcriptional regulator NikR [Rhizobiaceae bacterium]|nr:nickel-responsive transcriptional regulator NikR [Rhizobiaceae bacterium]